MAEVEVRKIANATFTAELRCVLRWSVGDVTVAGASVRSRALRWSWSVVAAVNVEAVSGIVIAAVVLRVSSPLRTTGRRSGRARRSGLHAAAGLAVVVAFVFGRHRWWRRRVFLHQRFEQREAVGLQLGSQLLAPAFKHDAIIVIVAQFCGFELRLLFGHMQVCCRTCLSVSVIAVRAPNNLSQAFGRRADGAG